MTDVPMLAWIMLAAFGAAMVAIDLFVAGAPGKPMTFRNSLAWSIVWFGAGLGFTIPVWMWLGSERGGEYLAGYVIERSLSLDNVFVFALLFAGFAVPPVARQAALMWGILGAIVLRVIMIFLGIGLLEAAHWLLYVFGAFLLYTGVKMATSKHDEDVDLEHNRTLKLVRRIMPITDEYHGTKLTVKQGGKRFATPLVAVLAVIATTDLIFALDSIPAIFAITLDPFVVVSANVLALCGMRSLYFLLEGMLGQFRFLQPALAVLLVIIGAKLILVDIIHLPTWVSLALVVVIVGGGIALSILSPGAPKGAPPTPTEPPLE
ncbi:MAG: TerC/Alx family metal homeostasis membrane protein [Thermoleophilia bacterium]|nr:TerC/Alx family metal homeostasis membrane protein [Thermoleophilia bacterium]